MHEFGWFAGWPHHAQGTAYAGPVAPALAVFLRPSRLVATYWGRVQIQRKWPWLIYVSLPDTSPGYGFVIGMTRGDPLGVCENTQHRWPRETFFLPQGGRPGYGLGPL